VTPPLPSPFALDLWCRMTDLLSWWFRYRCEGYENIPADRSCLIAGYHGRPAFDMFILMAEMYRRDGRFPYGVSHRALFGLTPTRALMESLAMYGGSDEETATLVQRGEPIAVLPGGARECYRSSKVLYRVDWGNHRGYLRLALRHRIPIVPVAASGVDEFFHIIGNGYENSMRLFGTDVVPLCLPLGVAGVPFPLGLPRPVRVRQLIGPPIEVEMLEGLARRGEKPGDPRFLNRCHARVTAAVQELVDRASSDRPCPPGWDWRACGAPRRRPPSARRARRRPSGGRAGGRAT
jgi:1-acyl-sn-glycerol-3-phosphate acyltransferase